MPATRAVFQGQPVWELRNGNARAVIAPQAGGRLLFWEIGGRRLLHWPDQADWSNPAKIRGGNPLLFPFIARHFVDGVVGRWRDGSGTVRDMPMHGFARNAVFTAVVPRTPTSPNDEEGPVELAMEIAPTDQTRAWYPFDFRFRVVHVLDRNSLTVRFETENRSQAPMPYQAGHHFYFALPAEERSQWSLLLPPAHQARQASDGSIASNGTSLSRFSLDDASLLDCFHILDAPGRLQLQHPDGRTIDFLFPPDGVPWHTVTTWTEKPESPFYCVEPWLGLPNAIHHGQGLRLLVPGATESATCTLRASGW
ncbi:MAG: hypothetical protein SFU85_07135 [Candidatus Methylacidiphilales bacterium]|nr:hypothetical protein [Candidatus Methylacidiphilales bacterium]